MNNYYVQIINKKTRKVIKEIGPLIFHRAEKAERGVLVNLNHEEYITKIIQKT